MNYQKKLYGAKVRPPKVNNMTKEIVQRLLLIEPQNEMKLSARAVYQICFIVNNEKQILCIIH